MSATAHAQPLTIGISQYPATLHPGIDSMMAKTYVLGFTRRPLVVYDTDWEKTCLLCTELPTLGNELAVIEKREDGSEGIAATYTIQPDAKWGDGTPLTTKDVLFTWQVGKTAEVGVVNYKLYSEDIVDITIIDEKTFTVHFDKVACDFNALSNFDILPDHLEREVFEKDPANYRNATLYVTEPTNPGLYYGPYLVSGTQIGQSITLAPNPHWWGDKPSITDITIRSIENTASLSAGLLSGDIDMIAGELGLTVDQALSLEKRLSRQNKAIDTAYKPGLIYEHIDLNLDQPLLRDKDIRQALLMGLDRETLSQQLFEGKQPVAQTNIHPLDTTYNASITSPSYDPQAAIETLQRKGCQKNENDVFVCDGTPLSFTFTTTAGNTSRELVQQAIQSQWKEIGVNAIIKNETPRVMFGETAQKRKFDGAMMYAWMSAPENIPETTLHSEQIPTEENGWAGQNFPGYKNSEMDEIIDELEVTCGVEESKLLWQRLQALYADDLPALPLYFRAESYFTPSTLKNVNPTGHQFPSSLWSEYWLFEK